MRDTTVTTLAGLAWCARQQVRQMTPRLGRELEALTIPPWEACNNTNSNSNPNPNLNLIQSAPLLHPLGENFSALISHHTSCACSYLAWEEGLQTLLSMPQPVTGGSPNPPVHIPAYHGRVPNPSCPHSSLSQESPQTLLSTSQSIMESLQTLLQPVTGGSPNPPVHAQTYRGESLLFSAVSHISVDIVSFQSM